MLAPRASPSLSQVTGGFRPSRSIRFFPTRALSTSISLHRYEGLGAVGGREIWMELESGLEQTSGTCSSKGQSD